MANKALADTATLIKSWPEYQTRFGGIRPVKPVLIASGDAGAITPNADIVIPANDGAVDLQIRGGIINAYSAITYDIEFTVGGTSYAVPTVNAAGNGTDTAAAIFGALDGFFTSNTSLGLNVNLNSLTITLTCNASSDVDITCLLYTSPSPRDLSTSRMPSSA